MLVEPERMRKQIAAIAVAALLVFAGCSAGGDGGATTTAAETTGTTGGDASPVYESPLDGQTVAENHEAIIRDAGTFTLVSTSNQTQGDQSFVVNSTTAVDMDSGEYFSRQETQGRSVEEYGYGNDTAFRKLSVASGETQYSVPEQTPNTSQLAGSQIASFVDAFALSHTGTEAVDGTETHVYEATGVEELNESAPGFSEIDVENVTSIDAQVYVTDDGLVKRFAYSLSMSTDQGNVSLGVDQRYAEIGSTAVEQPPWLDDARENTSA